MGIIVGFDTLKSIVLVFEVHQPHRLRPDFFWQNRFFRRVEKKNFFSYYFGHTLNRDIFERASKKCYLPSNQILLDLIDKYKGESKKVKIAFSISGVFLEQCEMFGKDVLECFKQLAETGCVEFLGQTYYHSLASLYPEREEFIKQVKMHQELMKELFGYVPRVFENTELLYNNAIAKTVEMMGYKGIYTEGVERILRDKSPNYLYAPKGCETIKILLRNYKLADDVGFRFSARKWNEWPLTSEKYVSWLAAASGDCVNIFLDYETFGEHHWPETGIHGFLSCLPEEILKREQLVMATPSDVVERFSSVGEIDVPELGGTVSWADMERDSSGWLGNTMQWAYYTSVRRLEPYVKEMDDEAFLRSWRIFQTSDHMYYMFTAGGGPGEVHSYFSPFGSPVDAFITAQAALLDFESRIRLASVAANEPFLFYRAEGKKNYTGVMVWSLKGFINALREVGLKSIEFHTRKRDFEKWAEISLRDNLLASDFRMVRLSRVKGRRLRKAMVEVAVERCKRAVIDVQKATRFF